MAKETQKKFQKDLQESAHKIWLAGLGAFTAASEESGRLVEESGRFFNKLVERGEEVEAQGRKSFRKAREEFESTAKKTKKEVEGRFDEVWEKIDDRLTDAMHRFGVPTREEIQTLTRRVEELNSKVDALRGAPAEKRTVYHVASHEDGWKVEIEGTSRPTSVHGTKADAVEAAKELAQGHVPSQVVVHKKDGKFQTEYSYDAN